MENDFPMAFACRTLSDAEIGVFKLKRNSLFFLLFFFFFFWQEVPRLKVSIETDHKLLITITKIPLQLETDFSISPPRPTEIQSHTS